MVRLGGAVYGLKHTMNEKNMMKRVLGVKARVIQTAMIRKGDTAGYSATYIAEKDEKIAIISIGYGDGIFRSLSNKKMILGRVSMDNLIVKGDGLEVGDWVELLNDSYDQDDMGEEAGTIGYEVISYIGKSQRYNRVYK
jgi:alanine racemase